MIETKGLYFSYTGAPPYVLADVNLRIGKGEYVSVVGDNGSGKTTLMRLILKFLKPTGGTVETMAERIGYVPQKNDSAHAGFPITVRETLQSYRRLLHVKDKNEVETNLKRVGMAGFMDALMGTLSGGQSQKVMIARALTGNPDLLILDEPSTGVDPGSQNEIYAILREINRQQGITVLSVEHNLPAAVSNSTLIYHLVDGQGHLCSPKKYADEFIYKRRV